MSSATQHAASAIRSLATGFTDLLFPAVCWACRAAEPVENGLCDTCNVELLSLISRNACSRCGSSLGPNVPDYDEGCWCCPNPLPHFEKVTRLGPYKTVLRRAVIGLKFDRFHPSRLLGSMLARRIETALGTDELDLIVPVPSHWRRRIYRGFDHSRILASELSRELDIPLLCDLVRVRHTPPQTHLSRTRRLENVRGAFEMRKNSDLQGANVLLVDDVTTTGATADESARILLSAGASNVQLAVLAKAESPIAYSDRK